MKAVLAILALFAAFVLQAQLSARVAPVMWRPDLVFAVVLTAALLLPGASLAVVAFIGGFLEGALLGHSMGAFIVSRLIAALVAQMIVEPLEINLPVAFGVATFAAGMANLVFLLIQPTTEILWWLNVSLRQSLLTGLLVTALMPFGIKTARNASTS